MHWKSGLPKNFKRKTGKFMAYVYDLVRPNKNPDLQGPDSTEKFIA